MFVLLRGPKIIRKSQELGYYYFGVLSLCRHRSTTPLSFKTTPPTVLTSTMSTTTEVPEVPEDQKPHLALGARMKEYEATTTSMNISPNLPYIIRLDGHKFSTFTRPFTKPYDERFGNAMLKTAEKLLLHYNAVSAYTCSDEITLCFPAINAEEQQISFNGRVTKLSTLTAAFASVCFDRALREQTFDPVVDARLIAHLETSVPHFDSRVFNVPSEKEILNNLVWRSHYDCVRNSVSGLASKYMTPREQHGLHTGDLQRVLKEQHNVDWFSYPNHFKYGSLLKRERYEIEAKDNNGNPVTAQRTRVIINSFDIVFTPENVSYIMRKYH